MFLIFALRSKSLNNIFFRVSAVVPIVELVALNISRFVSFFTALSAIFGVFVRSRFSGSIKVTLMRISIARWRKSFRALINIHVDEYPRIFGKKIMSRVFVGSQFNDLTTDNFRVKQTHFWVGMNKLWSLSAMRVCLTKFHFHKTPNLKWSLYGEHSQNCLRSLTDHLTLRSHLHFFSITKLQPPTYHLHTYTHSQILKRKNMKNTFAGIFLLPFSVITNSENYFINENSSKVVNQLSVMNEKC